MSEIWYKCEFCSKKFFKKVDEKIVEKYLELVLKNKKTHNIIDANYNKIRLNIIHECEKNRKGIARLIGYVKGN